MSPAAGKKALITGAAGFIGSHVARYLVAEGWSVHLIVRPASDLGILHEARERVVSHVHDGTTTGLQRIVEQAQPDVVFHLASLFLSQHRPEEVEPLVRSNILFGTQLAEAMAGSGCGRLINTGTSWQHFENSLSSPVNLYAATKQAFEAVLQYYVEACSLSVVTLKLFDTYGPRDPRPKLFTLLRKVAMESEPLAMSLGEQLIDLVYIDDVVAAFVLAAERLLAGEAQGHERYAVSSGAPLPLRNLVELYGRIVGRELPIRWGERPYRPREVMVPWNTGVSLPGWEPRVGLAEGLRRMVDAGAQFP